MTRRTIVVSPLAMALAFLIVAALFVVIAVTA